MSAAPGGFSIGRDVTLSIVTDIGTLRMSQMTSFMARQEIAELKSDGIDSVNREEIVYKGWTGTFMVDRRNNNIDAYFARLEADFYKGIRHIATITQTIQELSGSISQFRFTEAKLKYTSGGEWAGDKLVKQEVAFFSSFRKQTA